MKDLIERIFSIETEEDFVQCALEVYSFQKENVPVYSQFVRLLNRPEPKTAEEIPFLPVGFFKTHEIIANGRSSEIRFLSSGTTGMVRSQHLVADTSIYKRSFLETYIRFIGDPKDQVILALLPNYVEQGESSLVFMVDELISQTQNELSGFYLNDSGSLMNAVDTARNSGKKIVLFGVSYALLDLAETNTDLSDVLVIETGGMKGRRKELTKEELHAELNKGFGTQFISSEYGMCELLSQAYSDKDGLFELPNWMRFQLRDINDPFTKLSSLKTGGVDVIDLANIYSCSFISTQDLGRNIDGKLLLMGRFDHSDIRGCNLLVQ